MANAANVWVVVADNKWGVRREGSQRLTRSFDTQREAIDYGRRLAKTDGVELLIQGTDGKIRDRDSHGNDPYPPQG